MGLCFRLWGWMRVVQNCTWGLPVSWSCSAWTVASCQLNGYQNLWTVDTALAIAIQRFNSSSWHDAGVGTSGRNCSGGLCNKGGHCQSGESNMEDICQREGENWSCEAPRAAGEARAWRRGVRCWTVLKPSIFNIWQGFVHWKTVKASQWWNTNSNVAASC